MDGKASGAIVNHYAMKHNKKIELIGVDYNERVPLEKIDNKSGNTIVIVDFSLAPEDMLHLKESQNLEVIWIDHHKSSIIDSEKYGYDDLDGKRIIGQAACELAWMYFFPDEIIPKGINLLGAYDVWNYQNNSDVLPFQYGVRLYHNHPLNNGFWNPILLNDESIVQKYIQEGLVLVRYREIENKNLINTAGYLINFEHCTFLVMNRSGANALLFKDYKKSLKDIDAFMTFYYDGIHNEWRFSMFQSNLKKEDWIDILSIARKYKGGGHAGACGFSLDYLPDEFTHPY
jgi:oligoribonuclease NrnB/cAMP/cGMP phosphodiesterase (DHH superfamily)